MAVNVASCLGDVMVLVFAWIYASGFLGNVGWLTYLFIVAVLLFQTVFWITVEVIRAMYAGGQAVKQTTSSRYFPKRSP
ncbi:hypothetical protein V5799_004814 [Amblyomma americanum]|uniref:Uncharacterized protein n=1 Tax=Amblyomma americanum TaxID=6943 RepID=A0AAQ4D514_AMBAM